MKNITPNTLSCWTQSCLKGFTLIELLVTICIIAILAAISFPVLGMAQKRAKTTACLSNLRQIGGLVQLYAGEHDNNFPLATYQNQSYVVALSEYLPVNLAASNKNIYVSPAAAIPTTSYGGKNLTYAVHNGLFGGASQTAVKVLAVTHPSEVIMIGNGAQIKDYGYSCAYTFWQPWEMNQGKGYNAASYLNKPIPFDESTNVDDWAGSGYLRYVQNGNKAVNVLMVDGHAETIAKGKVLYKNVVYDQ